MADSFFFLKIYSIIAFGGDEVLGNFLNRSIEKKKQIVDAIVKLMDEEGLKNVTIKDICKAANISVGSFYHYFQSKDSIHKELYNLMDAFFEESKDDISGHSSVSENIISFVSHFGFYVEQWGYFANLLIIRTSLECPSDNKRPQRQIYKVLKEIIKTGIENKEFIEKVDSDELASAIFVLIRGYLFEWAKIGEEYPVRENMVKHARWLMDALCV